VNESVSCGWKPTFIEEFLQNRIFIPVFPVFFLSPVLFFLSLDLISFYYLFFLLFTVIFCFIFNFWLPFTLYICHLFVVMVFVCRLFYFYFADRCTNKNNTRTHTRTILQASHTNTGTHTHTNTGTLALNFFSSFSLRLFHFYALYTTASIYLISVSAFR